MSETWICDIAVGVNADSAGKPVIVMCEQSGDLFTIQTSRFEVVLCPDHLKQYPDAKPTVSEPKHGH